MPVPTLIETTPGNHSLVFDAGDVDGDVVEHSGHEPNGYFWEGIATLLIDSHPNLADRFEFDPEGSMFCAFGPDRAALAELGKLMASVMADPDELRRMIDDADDDHFDD